jgi:hypothetical protein
MDDEGTPAFHDHRCDQRGVASLFTKQTKRPSRDEPWKGKLVWAHDSPPEVEPLTAEEGPDLNSGRTQVLVTKTVTGEYTLHIDGLKVPLKDPVAGTTTTVANINRFRGPFVAPETGKTVIGPVSITLLTETAQMRPLVATGRIVQQTATDSRDRRDDVIQTFGLESGNMQDDSVPVTNVPFPCRFTESPYIVIDDVYSLRKYQAARFFKTLLPLVLGFLTFIFTFVQASTLASAGAARRAAKGVTIPQLGIWKWFSETLMESLFLTFPWARGRVRAIVDAREAATRGAATGVAAAISAEQTGLMRNLTDVIIASTQTDVPLAILSSFLQLTRYTTVATFLRPDAIELYRTAVYGPKETRTDVRLGFSDVRVGAETEAARSNLFLEVTGAVVGAVSAFFRSGPPRRKRKFTLRGLTQTLSHLMAIDDETPDQGAGSTNELIRERYKNEAVLADYLMEPKRRLPTRVFDRFQTLLANLGLGLSQSVDSQGNAPRGIFFADIGGADLSGLDTEVLRQSYVGTVIDLHIIDPGNSTGVDEYKIRIQAEDEVAFQAGFHASGLADDIDELEDTIRRFDIVHCDAARTKKNFPQSSWYSTGGKERAMRLFKLRKGDVGWLQWWAKIQEITCERMCSGIGKLKGSLLKGETVSGSGYKRGLFQLDKNGRPVSIRRLQRIHQQQPVQLPTLNPKESFLLQVLPQRAVLVATLTPTFIPSTQMGILALGDGLEQIHPQQPIDGAIEESSRSARGYGASMSLLVQTWESQSQKRLLWYRVFVAKDLKPDNSIKRVGMEIPSFATDTIAFPMTVRDSLQRWSPTTEPSLFDNVDQVSTFAPTRLAGTASDLEHTHITPTASIQDGLPKDVAHASAAVPSSLAELLALHSVSDMLISRLVMRSRFTPEQLCVRGALHSVKLRIKRAVAISNLATNDGRQGGIPGVLDRNDLLFVCLPGGIDAARLLHCMGAWKRDADVTLAVGRSQAIMRLDNTLTQRLASHNRWPAEAQATLVTTGQATSTVVRWPLAVAPVYALQNMLAVSDGIMSETVKMRIHEALDSFTRTEKLATMLGVTDQMFNPVAMCLVKHWPVLLAVRHGSMDAISFRQFVQNEDLGRVRSKVRLPLRLGDPGVPTPTYDETVRSIKLRNAMLRMDLQDLYSDSPPPDVATQSIEDKLAEELGRMVVSSMSSSDATRNTRSAHYFVPFGHGATPHSRVRSLFHPGSSGIDSAPVWCDHLRFALLRSIDPKVRAARASAGTRLRIKTHEGICTQHPFEIVASNDGPMQTVSCCLVAMTTAVEPGASAKKATVDDVVAATESYFTQPDLMDNYSLTDVLVWNAERLVQACLVAIGSGALEKGGLVYCGPPKGPRHDDTTLVDDRDVPVQQTYRLLYNLRHSIVKFILALQMAYIRARDEKRTLHGDAVQAEEEDLVNAGAMAAARGGQGGPGAAGPVSAADVQNFQPGPQAEAGPTVPVPADGPVADQFAQGLANAAAALPIINAPIPTGTSFLDGLRGPGQPDEDEDLGSPVQDADDIKTIEDMIIKESPSEIERRWRQTAAEGTDQAKTTILNFQSTETVLDFARDPERYVASIKRIVLEARLERPQFKTFVARTTAEGPTAAAADLWITTEQNYEKDLVERIMNGDAYPVGQDDPDGLQETRSDLAKALEEYTVAVDKRRISEKHEEEENERLRESAELIQKQNTMAFVCSVSLADAILQSLLGNDNSPWLVASSEDAGEQQAIEDAERLVLYNLVTPTEENAVSVHEAAIVLEQLVGGQTI